MIERVVRTRGRLFLITAWMTISAAQAAFSQANAPQTISDPQTVNATAKLPEFAVVSVKQNKSGANFAKSGFSPEGIHTENSTLLFIIRGAYGMFNSLDDKFIGVPGWARTDRYDIEAKVDPADIEALHNLRRHQRDLMFQALLADRFNLKVHPETREQPVYALVIAKNGPRFTEAKPGDTYPNGIKDAFDGHTGPGVVNSSRHGIAGQAIPMSTLVMILTQTVDRTVMDKTALTGKYDLKLDWTPETAASTSPGTDSAVPPPDDSGPSIFTAIQDQLGLKLEPAKAQVEVLVIDHVEQPSPN